MPEDAPPCVCGERKLHGNGASLGPGYSDEWFKCESCRRPMLVMWRGMAVSVQPAAQVTELSEEHLVYLNGPLNVTMRAYTAAVERVRDAANKAAWGLGCELLGLPRDSKIRWDSKRVEADPNKSGRYMCTPDGTDAGTRKLELFDKMLDLERAHVANGSLIAPITPPKLPRSLVAHVRENKEWWKVDHDLSAELCVPPDPRRTAHDEYFKSIFDKVRGAGHTIELTEIPNGYYNDHLNSEPWYRFAVRDKLFTVGPRKRVISITVESDKPFTTNMLRALAVRDGVTYDADDGWQSEVKEAKKVIIHAWGDEKAVEYLKAALGESK